MPKKIHLFLIVLLFQYNAVFSQSKIVLDKNSGGGYCNNYFDLGDQGFALIFNKNKDDESTNSNATLQNNIFYYSKDLSKKANFKISSTGIFTINATKNHLILVDRLSTKYYVRVLDFMGREVSSRKFDLNTIGLNQDVISKIHYTDQGKMIFEVYDGHDDLHIYTINLIDARGGELMEVDIPLPSANPLESMTFLGHWKMVAQNMGYYILARKGANSEFDPNAIAYHIAFYDEDFNLFREFLLDNFLMPNVQMIGKEASFILNPTLQSFAVSCLIMRNGKSGFMVANYGMNSNSNVMSLFWHKEFEITQNGKYRLVENDGLSVPIPPVISNKGPKIIVNVVKNKMNVSEEAINQMVVFDAQGNAVFNEIQMGNFEGLNLDNYCVDNDNLYSRIKKLQIASVLKPYCEQVNTDVLDIDVDADGNELAIVRNYDISKNQVIIYRFNHK
ncbi:MAG: hypothetical protein K9H61_13455 [Bacteroidia bacterium]|nr:hypothetical protein [Bacteroidia bacterium]MCF8447990.1 hypothetical protein [Bacteroidia bacterium]